MKAEGSESLAQLVAQLPLRIRGSPFARFFSWCKAKRRDASFHHRLGKGSTDEDHDVEDYFALLPSHLPRRPAWLFHSSRPLSRRRAARWQARRLTVELTEIAWSGLVFLMIGSPKTKHEYEQRLGVYSSNSRQEIAFDSMCTEASLVCRLRPEEALALGCDTARLHKLQKILDDSGLSNHVGHHLENDSSEAAALPVCVEEIKNGCLPLVALACLISI